MPDVVAKIPKSYNLVVGCQKGLRYVWGLSPWSLLYFFHFFSAFFLPVYKCKSVPVLCWTLNQVCFISPSCLG